MIIRSMRTNHLEEPLGYGMESPVFPWTADETTGAAQKSARVRVWRDGACVYDSGQQIAPLHAHGMYSQSICNVDFRARP